MFDTTVHDLPPLGEPPPEEPDRHRHRAQLAIAAIIVLVLALPIALWLLRRGGEPVATPPAPTTAPSATAAPSGTGASATPSTTATVPAPDGRIAADTLKNATLEIPAWPADNLTGPSGRIKFTDGEAILPPSSASAAPARLAIYDLVYGDVDRDGAQETVAMIFCGYQGGSAQLVVFDRTVSGSIVTMGRVVATTGEIRTLQPLRVLADGTVEVKVSDYQRCCGDETPQLFQTRGYRWNGSAFVQSTGPAKFPVNQAVTETAVASSELVLGPAANGVRRGVVTVRVSYTRGAAPATIRLTFYGMKGLQRDGTAWPPVRGDTPDSFSVDIAAPALGRTTSYTFAFSAAAGPVPETFEITGFGVDGKGNGIGESNPYNNDVSVTVRVAN